jgi:hypothetical protein
MIFSGKPIGNEDGSALIITLLILTVTLLMGIFATTITINELQISGTDLHQKIAFYEADGGTEFGAQLLEENIACYGFAETMDTDGVAITEGEATIDGIQVKKLAFWSNDEIPDEDNPDFYYPADFEEPEPHTNIYLAGTTDYSLGSSIQMAAGYEGVGKGASGGGIIINYELLSERYSQGKSAAAVKIGWRHVVGKEEECKYR